MMKQKISEMPQNADTKHSINVTAEKSAVDEKLLPHFKELLNFINEFYHVHSVYAAAKAGIADILGGGPKSADYVAGKTGNNPDAIYRLMRALAGIGIFRETSERVFELTPKAELLQENHPMSLRPFALSICDPAHRDSWSNIMYSIKEGKPSFEYTFNMSFFDYIKDHSDDFEKYAGFLTACSNINGPVIAAGYPFSGFHKVVDIGGGQGSLLVHILRQNPSVNGILFDLPHVVQGPNEISSDIAERCEIVGGDFFEAVPEGGDLYIMQQVIHDWSDEPAVKILANCRKAVTDNGRVLVVDAVLSPGNDRDINKFDDITMLIGTDGGRERTEQEFRKLFEKAGLELTRIIPTESIRCYSIVEGKKR